MHCPVGCATHGTAGCWDTGELGQFRAEAASPALQVLFSTNLRSLYLQHYHGLELHSRFSDLCDLTVR